MAIDNRILEMLKNKKSAKCKGLIFVKMGICCIYWFFLCLRLTYIELMKEPIKVLGPTIKMLMSLRPMPNTYYNSAWKNFQLYFWKVFQKYFVLLYFLVTHDNKLRPINYVFTYHTINRHTYEWFTTFFLRILRQFRVS